MDVWTDSARAVAADGPGTGRIYALWTLRDGKSPLLQHYIGGTVEQAYKVAVKWSLENPSAPVCVTLLGKRPGAGAVHYAYAQVVS